jgi:hypothetical protein
MHGGKSIRTYCRGLGYGVFCEFYWKRGKGIVKRMTLFNVAINASRVRIRGMTGDWHELPAESVSYGRWFRKTLVAKEDRLVWRLMGPLTRQDAKEPPPFIRVFLWLRRRHSLDLSLPGILGGGFRDQMVQADNVRVLRVSHPFSVTLLSEFDDLPWQTRFEVLTKSGWDVMLWCCLKNFVEFTYPTWCGKRQSLTGKTRLRFLSE